VPILRSDLFQVHQTVTPKPTARDYVRLQPSPAEADLSPGIEARLADPLWLLGRQWQLLEFLGEDAGSPANVQLEMVSLPVVGLGAFQHPPLTSILPDGPPVQALVEQEAAFAAHPRFDVEAGQHAQRLCAWAGVPATAAQLAAPFPAAIPDARSGDPDWTATTWPIAFAAGAVSARLLLAALRPLSGGRGNPLTGFPADLNVPSEERTGALAALGRWLDWANDLVLEPQGENPYWQRSRLEYAFSLAASDGKPVAPVPGGPDETHTLALDAAQYRDGRFDWSSVDARQWEGQAPPAQPAPQAAPAPGRRIPIPVSFPGMPADRYWEFEDGRVNLADIDAGRTDLVRMLMLEFSLAYGNDWFLIPVRSRVNSLHKVTTFVVTDTFGVTTTVKPSRNEDGTAWSMYELSAMTEAAVAQDWLYVAPVAWEPLEGPALEQVLFVRDEMANLCWGIEKTVQGSGGEPIDRSLEARSFEPPRRPLVNPKADWLYRLDTKVPVNWIPLVASQSNDGLKLTRGAMFRIFGAPTEPTTIKDPKQGAIEAAYAQVIHLHQKRSDFIQPVGENIDPLRFRPHPRGRILQNRSFDDPLTKPEIQNPLVIEDEEIGREGAIVQRQFRYARSADGRAWLWVGRSKTSGRGEASSGLRYDTITRG
jgi:hypothetical protein